MIKVTNVTKTYKKGAPPAIENVCLTFEKGKIYGLLGRNGAGKTTLINIITNRLFASGGEVTIDGLPAKENDFAQEKIFCMTEKGSYHSDLSAGACFTWAAAFYPGFDRAYAEKLAENFSLNLKKRIRMLSTGYGSIVKLIITLASNAPVMIFDEPTLGLDAGMRELFYRLLLEKYAEIGNTIIISTHLIGEIDSMLENIVIIDDGKIIVDSTAEELTARAYIISGPKEKAEAFASGKKTLHSQHIGSFAAITVDEKLTAESKKAAATLGLEVSGAKLQDIFIKLTTKPEGGNK